MGTTKIVRHKKQNMRSREYATQHRQEGKANSQDDYCETGPTEQVQTRKEQWRAQTGILRESKKKLKDYRNSLKVEGRLILPVDSLGANYQ